MFSNYANVTFLIELIFDGICKCSSHGSVNEFVDIHTKAKFLTSRNNKKTGEYSEISEQAPNPGLRNSCFLAKNLSQVSSYYTYIGD